MEDASHAVCHMSEDMRDFLYNICHHSISLFTYVHTKSASRNYWKNSESVQLCQGGAIVFSNQLLDCAKEQDLVLVQNQRGLLLLLGIQYWYKPDVLVIWNI